VRAIRHAGTDPAFRSAMYTAKIVGIIATVTGVAWIFAVLVVVSSEVAFSYLFALFASSQGAALFYFHVRHHCVSVPMCSMNCTALIRFLRGLCVWSTQEQKRTLLLQRAWLFLRLRRKSCHVMKLTVMLVSWSSFSCRSIRIRSRGPCGGNHC
jgi:hypothetical protein